MTRNGRVRFDLLASPDTRARRSISLDVLQQNVNIARGFKPLTSREMHALRERVRPSSGDGHLELYKTTKKYDGKVGREQHGYPPPEQLPL